MRILLLGNFGKGALENYYLNGFISIDEHPEKFEITEDYYQAISAGIYNKVINKFNPSKFYKPINEKLKEFISGKVYDLILVFKGLTLFPDTIAGLKDHTTILACYNPDHPYEFYSEGSGNTNILRSINFYDLYFTYSQGIRDGLSQRFNTDAFVIPFGFDKTSAPLKDTKSEFDQCWIHIGAYDQQRSRLLTSLNEPGIRIYGEEKWRTRNRNTIVATKYYQGRSLFDDEYKLAVSRADGIFNLLREQNLKEGSHNMRTFEVPGYGGLMVSNRTPEQQEYFEEGSEAIYFDTLSELKDKIQFLSHNRSEISRIKAAAFRRATSSGYSYLDRTKQLMRIVQQHLA